MSYLLFCALIGLCFGLLFLLSPEALGRLGTVLNAVLFTLNGQTLRYRFWIGLVFLAIAVWIFYVGLQVAAWYIIASWMVALVFGLLFLFLPGWLTWMSKASNVMLVSTDELAIGWRRVIGIALIVSSIYIFYGIFMSMK
jgi:hypothetical protein